MKTTAKILLLLLVSAVLFIQCEKEVPHIKIPDNHFQNALIEAGIDTDGDGQISHMEAEAVTSLRVSGDSITDLTGIEKFINLDTLICSSNRLTSLDVSQINSLVYLGCSHNDLTSLDVSNNTLLRYLG